MNIQEMMNKIQFVLEDAKAGVLATVDSQGKPHMRWMTPILLDEWPNTLLAVTSPHFSKVFDLQAMNKVEWMLQTKALDQVINIKGYINILDNPSVKAQVMESVGSKFRVFWKVNNQNTDFIVLETVIEETVWFVPVKGIRETVKFNMEGADR